MNRKWIWLFGLVLLQIQYGYTQDQKQRKPIIIIDPGHGGIDSGAVSKNGLQEKEVVLDIARHILHWNKSLFENKYEIYLTRYTDTLISLKHRTRLAKYLQPDLFISLHINHAKNKRARGVEVFIYTKEGPYTNTSKDYARSVLVEMEKKLGFRNRGVKQANFQVLRDNQRVCPAVLVELGFLSNGDEEDYFLETKNMKATALTIIMKFKKLFKV